MPERAEARSPKRGMCAAILSLEAIVLGLTTPVMIASPDLPVAHGLRGRARPERRLPAARRAAALRVGVRRRAGCSRSPRSGSGFVVPMMFFLGAIFALLWGTAYFLGRKIERERAEAYAAYDAGQAG